MANRLATAFESKVVVLHVAEPEPEFVGFEPGPILVGAGPNAMPLTSAVARDFREEHRRLEALKQSFDEGLEVKALQIQGSTVEKILLEAATHDAGFIVMGSHGHGALYHLLVGSVTEGVLKGATCPVVVVPSAKKLRAS